MLVVSSKREVYTARLSFIWVVKESEGGGGGGGYGISYYFVGALYIFINAKEWKHFQWEGKLVFVGGVG